MKQGDPRRSLLLKNRRERREREENPLRITDSPHHLLDNGHPPPERSLVPYKVQPPIVPEKTQELVKWLKRPVADETEIPEEFVPDPTADQELRKAQQTAMEIKISRLFEGNKRANQDISRVTQKDLLSPFTQYFLRNRETREEEQTLRRTFDSLQHEISASQEKKQSLDEKHRLVHDYVKWINRQIHVSSAVREQTAHRAAKDRRQCEKAQQNRMEAFEKQKTMMEHRITLRKALRARKKWLVFMEKFEHTLGKTFYDIADFCGFYEMTSAVLKLCTEMQESERLQLDTAQREAEIRPEEWSSEKASLEERLRDRLATRDRLCNEMIELQNLNRAHKNNHESDRAEWERLIEGIDDLSYSIRSLTGTAQTAYPEDNLQRLEAFERFLIVTERVEDKLLKQLGPKLDYDNVFHNENPDETLLPKIPAPPCDMNLLPRC